MRHTDLIGRAENLYYSLHNGEACSKWKDRRFYHNFIRSKRSGLRRECCINDACMAAIIFFQEAMRFMNNLVSNHAVKWIQEYEAGRHV